MFPQETGAADGRQTWSSNGKPLSLGGLRGDDSTVVDEDSTPITAAGLREAAMRGQPQ